ncbi:MAG: hypothetical protein AMXMBFR84_09410 [Candidatus Hydrogenedentota bacterium]
MHTKNRFQDFFEEGKYVVLKNYLYNYRLRKRAIESLVDRIQPDTILEIGSGISPVVTTADRVVYSELSTLALSTLRRIHPQGAHVAADATRLPFGDGAFHIGIGSEVFEHLPDDRTALHELARVIRPGGRLIVTFPHRQFYFANDDRFVHHFRRYELADMVEKLESAGLRVTQVRTILGPLEKITMMITVACFALAQRAGGNRQKNGGSSIGLKLLAPAFDWANKLYACFAWADARITPRRFATVLLVEAEKPSSKSN